MASNKLTDQVIISRVQDSMYHQCQKRGDAAPVDVLIDLGVLQKAKYEDWRFGRVAYLESICTVVIPSLCFQVGRLMRPSLTAFGCVGSPRINVRATGPSIVSAATSG